MVASYLNRVRLWHGRRQVGSVIGKFDALQSKLARGVARLKQAIEHEEGQKEQERLAFEASQQLRMQSIAELTTETTRASKVLERFSRFISA